MVLNITEARDQAAQVVAGVNPVELADQGPLAKAMTAQTAQGQLVVVAAVVLALQAALIKVVMANVHLGSRQLRDRRTSARALFCRWRKWSQRTKCLAWRSWGWWRFPLRCWWHQYRWRWRCQYEPRKRYCWRIRNCDFALCAVISSVVEYT